MLLRGRLDERDIENELPESLMTSSSLCHAVVVDLPSSCPLRRGWRMIDEQGLCGTYSTSMSVLHCFYPTLSYGGACTENSTRGCGAVRRTATGVPPGSCLSLDLAKVCTNTVLHVDAN